MFFKRFRDGRCGVGGTYHARRDRQGGSQSYFNRKRNFVSICRPAAIEREIEAVRTNDQTGTQNNRLYIAGLKIGALLAPLGRPMRTRSQVQLRGYSEPRLRCQPSTAPDLGMAQTASVPR